MVGGMSVFVSRAGRFSFVGLGILICIIWAFYLTENIRGARAWEKAQALMLSSHEPTELSEVIPPPVADGLNMAMAPIWVEVFKADAGTYTGQAGLRIRKLKLKPADKNNASPMPRLVNRLQGNAMDWDAWGKFLLPVDEKNKQSDTIAALAAYLTRTELQTVVDEVAKAANRTTLRWPYEYEKTFRMKVPPLSPLLDTAKFLELRAAVQLEGNNVSAASKDLRLLYLLAEKTGHEPGLIHCLVGMALGSVGDEVLSMGLQRRSWSDKELAEWQSFVVRRGILARGAQSLRGERALFLHVMNQMTAQEFALVTLFGGSELGGGDRFVTNLMKLFFYLRPRGWADLDRATYAVEAQHRIDRLMGIQNEDQLDVDYPEKREPEDKVYLCHPEIGDWRYPMSNMSLPALNSFVRKVIEMEAATQNSLAAIAIERYRLKNGKIPDSLDALVPAYLAGVPHDIIDGQPLRYRCVGVDSYIIYSVGWNGKDDGARWSQSKYRGDWVWPSKAGLADKMEASSGAGKVPSRSR